MHSTTSIYHIRQYVCFSFMPHYCNFVMKSAISIFPIYSLILILNIYISNSLGSYCQVLQRTEV